MRTEYVDSHLPKASDIDYTDIDEVCGYQLLLCKTYEREGGFGYPPATGMAVREVLRQGLRWLGEVKKQIEEILTGAPGRLEAIPALLTAYGFMFRICHSRPCHAYVREVRLRTAGKWVKGDRSINETDVALMLLAEADRDIHTLEDRYTGFAISVLGGWIDELMKHGMFRAAPQAESYRRLAYLLDSDLSAYLGSREQPGIKAQWAQAYTLTDEQADALDTRTLLSYIRFVSSAAHLNRQTIEEQDALQAHLLRKLLTHPDLNHYCRRALQQDTMNNEQLTMNN